ncbi:epoxide hydrolase family protein [Peredibacter starrii]|uniref:Epoxide hydrolase n=1 Tax=Peredibacter starrii TaxID=28202 RepID=A0AAX4HV39_9BACT|nr:epoxide hydrolase [Peredibacter starrii]WPU66810.1 epoxide hydrolase [Peredibacter starrii]
MDNTFNYFSFDKKELGARGPFFARPDLIEDFKIHISDARLDEITARVMNAKLPKQMPPSEEATSNWETGADIAWLEEFRHYWLTEYDWREEEQRLNEYPQYMAQVDDYQIHFYYVQGEGPNPLPLLLTHASQGSVVEFIDCISYLTEPSKHGGKAEDSFTVIIPSLPGFGFSSMPKKPIQAKTTAKIFNKLVTEILGHEHYVAQGGDIGSLVAVQLAEQFPENVKAIHLNLPLWFNIPSTDQTEDETAWIKEYETYLNGPAFDFQRIQSNRPMMAAVALTDSPIGTAAWIAEKFWAWSDHGGKLENTITKERLLTNIMLYLVNEGGIAASFWYSRAFQTELNWELHPKYIEVPTAIAIYPKEHIFGRPSIETARRGYNLVHYQDIPRGGHFAAMEQPELFSSNIRDAFRNFH